MGVLLGVIPGFYRSLFLDDYYSLALFCSLFLALFNELRLIELKNELLFDLFYL